MNLSLDELYDMTMKEFVLRKQGKARRDTERFMEIRLAAYLNFRTHWQSKDKKPCPTIDEYMPIESEQKKKVEVQADVIAKYLEASKEYYENKNGRR